MFNLRTNWYIEKPNFQEQSDYYIQPFQNRLWIYIFACLITGKIISIILYYGYKYQKVRFELLDLLFMPLDNVCNQGQYFSTKAKNIFLKIRLKFFF